MGVLAVQFLCVVNGAVGAVEDGLLEYLTVNRGSMAQPQPHKISGSGLLDLPTGILGGIGASCPSVRRLSFWLWRLRRLRG